MSATNEGYQIVNVTGWKYQFTRNAIIDHYRAQKKTEELPDSANASKKEIGNCILPMIS